MDNNSIVFSTILQNINEASKTINNLAENNNRYLSNIYTILDVIPKYKVLGYFLLILILYFALKNVNIRLNEILIFLISITIIYILLLKDHNEYNNFIIENNNKLKFLNQCLTARNIKVDLGGFNTLDNYDKDTPIKSYLFYDPYILDLMYNLKEYINYNINSYTNCLININNLLKISYQSDNLDSKNDTNIIDNFKSAIQCKKNSLNFLSSVIYRIPVSYITFEKLKNSVNMLHRLLNSHIAKLSKIFQNKLSIDKESLNYVPSDTFQIQQVISSNDMNDKNYNKYFDLY